ncbi:uncharacterized protein Z520_11336 [Fonsecaea multimorphosa CBS 102226]|uniref:Uncharacterized protein n=1 Tax=Fonsecaea multimorphosa CBS 102226 TaxID=1442371 RepID=A0A0D2K9I7_9EURO|nr:uncharacterized protein Z520_11336 [Fonsecaea multimorphosa CBS 102226]KIX93063.1 hypothetical protein Z520_11336 [Fonsecaea multimorphosa CBS 102226]OAL18309.1 hypothetical protein AYO22_10887 [Fonsecaea multimorphosa]
MSKVPDAWEDEWSTTADDKLPTPPTETESRRVSSKVTKAQRRAQQAEFNRQLWAEAEGPRETNYFLESRNVVPLRSEFKPPPILLSRKGPIVQKSQSPRPPTAGLQDLSLNNRDKNNSSADRGGESSEDEEEVKARELSLAERQAQAARDREEKQRKYEERRQELFGTSSSGASAGASTTLSSSSHQQGVGGHNNKSGTSSPAGSLTPPGSRSATPNRSRGGRGGGRRGVLPPGGGAGVAGGNHSINSSRNQSRGGSQHRELFDPSYASKPESTYLQRREQRENGVLGAVVHNSAAGQPLPQQQHVQEPIRAPRGPDGSGQGGFGFATSRASTSAPAPAPAPAPVQADEAATPPALSHHRPIDTGDAAAAPPSF